MKSDTNNEPFYDPGQSYQHNYENGPFGKFKHVAQDTAARPADIPFFNVLGRAISTPFGIPAGPLINGRFVKAALASGFDLPIYKTVRTHQFPSHPWPNVLPVAVSGDMSFSGARLQTLSDYTNPINITNSFGVPSYDPDVWQRDMADAASHAGPGQAVIGSFQGTSSKSGSVSDYVADFARGARLVKETGVPLLEVNLSCPNEGTSALLCFDTSRARAVVEAIRDEIGSVPLIVKLAYFPDDEGLRNLIQAIGPSIDAVDAINTLPAEVITLDGRQALPGEGRLRSGICGSSIRWAGLEMVRRLGDLRTKLGFRYSIFGTGGVSSVSDFDAYRLAGADVVMSATGAMWNPLLAREIKDCITLTQWA